MHVYDPDGTLIGKVLVPETVANVAWGGAKRNRLYICATTSLYAILLPVRGARRVIDLHVHFPMRLLGGVEAPRDVLRGMTRVARARRRQDPRGGAGDRRAAVQLPSLGRELARDAAAAAGRRRDRRVLGAVPPVQRDGPRRAVRRAAGERVLREADRADGRDRARGRGRRSRDRALARRPRARRREDRVHPLHRGRLPPRRRRPTRSPRTSASWPSAACSTSRSRTCSGARWRPTRRRCRSCPTRLYNRLFPQPCVTGLAELGEAAVARDVPSTASSSTSATCATTPIDETFRLVESLDRAAATRGPTP